MNNSTYVWIEIGNVVIAARDHTYDLKTFSSYEIEIKSNSDRSNYHMVSKELLDKCVSLHAGLGVVFFGSENFRIMGIFRDQLITMISYDLLEDLQRIMTEITEEGSTPTDHFQEKMFLNWLITNVKKSLRFSRPAIRYYYY